MASSQEKGSKHGSISPRATALVALVGGCIGREPSVEYAPTDMSKLKQPDSFRFVDISSQRRTEIILYIQGDRRYVVKVGNLSEEDRTALIATLAENGLALKN
ncbi:MAG: hypothetical protein UU76_C0033G0006 [Parcubacteria group bacterium GW2011_GWC1_41_7]|nr:MAG: hypothetical protein UU76_C0033G0006 [Parcubacteria group bacterium GW2011_GWC1_41_7]